MTTTRLINVDEEGNIISSRVIARLIERFGDRAGEGIPAITANMTFNEIEALGAQADGA